MAKYLVTGGCGFIGSHLVDALLAKGHDVLVLDDLSTGNPKNLPDAVPVIVGDVSDWDVVRKAMVGVDGCFHLAAVASVQRSTEEWAKTHRINQTGSIHVFDAAREQGGDIPLPVVFASSAAVYGDNAQLPLNEASETLPISPYGADKLGSELHGRAACRVFQSRIIGMRFFNVFGPRQDPASPYSGVISLFIDRVMRGQDITIFGDGEQTRDFVYVSDVVQCLMASMRHLDISAPGYFSAYNVCGGESVSINHLAETIIELRGGGSRVVYEPARSGDIRNSAGNPERASSDLGFDVSVNLRDGLSETLSWFQK